MKNIYLILVLCVTFASCAKKTSELETFLKDKTGNIQLPNKTFYVKTPIEIGSNINVIGNDSTIIICKSYAFKLTKHSNNVSFSNLQIQGGITK
jgi:hypothetical protein